MIDDSEGIKIKDLIRYPVKSMAGERLAEARITSRGLLGDRSYALVDDRNKVGTARKLEHILDCQARFVEEPDSDSGQPPAVMITLPDGRDVNSTQVDASRVLSAFFKHDLQLLDAPPPGVMLEFAAGTLAGRHAATTELPLAAGAPQGTFVDYGTLHLLTSSTLAALAEAYPGGCFDVRRFRPNILLETTKPGFVENGWLGRTLSLGSEVQLRVTIPCPRCVIPTLAQAGMPRDPQILRTVAVHNKQDLGEFGSLPCVGVCADVVRRGRLRVGDVVRLID